MTTRYMVAQNGTVQFFGKKKASEPLMSIREAAQYSKNAREIYRSQGRLSASEAEIETFLKS